jgi:hypothetical protein
MTPIIGTYFFMGKNLVGRKRKRAEGLWYFQDVESYLEHGSFLQMPEGIERKVVTLHEDSLGVVYDIGGLVACLKKVKEGTLSNDPKGRVSRPWPSVNENSPEGLQAKLVFDECHGLARGYLLNGLLACEAAM